MFRVNMVFLSTFFYFLAIISLSQNFITIQSDLDLYPLTKLREYMNGQEQSREAPDETVRIDIDLRYSNAIRAHHYTR